MLDRVVIGMAALAAELGTSPQQIDRWANLPSDPLRVRYLHGVPRMRRSRMRAWWRRAKDGGRGETVVRGWQVIAALAELSVSAAWRASRAQKDPLPVSHAEGGRVWAWASAVEDWRDDRELPRSAHRRLHPPPHRRKLRSVQGAEKREKSHPENGSARSEKAPRMPTACQGAGTVSSVAP